MIFMCLIPKDFILGHSLQLSAFGGDFSAKKCEQLACTHTTSRTPFLFECFKKKVQFCERMFGINRIAGKSSAAYIWQIKSLYIVHNILHPVFIVDGIT